MRVPLGNADTPRCGFPWGMRVPPGKSGGGRGFPRGSRAADAGSPGEVGLVRHLISSADSAPSPDSNPFKFPRGRRAAPRCGFPWGMRSVQIPLGKAVGADSPGEAAPGSPGEVGPGKSGRSDAGSPGEVARAATMRVPLGKAGSDDAGSPGEVGRHADKVPLGKLLAGESS